MLDVGAIGRNIVISQIDRTQAQVQATQNSIAERDQKIQTALASRGPGDGVAVSSLGGRGLKVDIAI